MKRDVRRPERPAWPPEVELQADLEPSRWIAPRLTPWDEVVGSPVTMVAPTGYPAYVRVLHPASRPREPIPSVTWREVTEWSGRMFHPTMQFERISVPRGPAQGPAPFNVLPRKGNMDEEMCAVLYEWPMNRNGSVAVAFSRSSLIHARCCGIAGSPRRP